MPIADTTYDQTWTAQQTFAANTVFTSAQFSDVVTFQGTVTFSAADLIVQGGQLLLDPAAIAFKDFASGFKLNLSPEDSTFASSKTAVIPYEEGVLPIVVAPASPTTDKTGQSASIGATTVFTTTKAGRYRISAYAVFTAVTTPGNLTLTAKYTDPQQAQTINFNRNNTIAYSAVGSEVDGNLEFYATAGSVIQFQTTLTGIATHNLYVRVERLP